MFEKMPFYGQVLLMVAFAAVIVAVGWWFMPGVKDMHAEIDRLDSELQDKQQEVAAGQAAERRLPQLQEEIANLERELTSLRQVLPTGPETGDLLSWIKNTGDASNLDLKSFAPGAMQPAEFYQEFPIEMQVIGRYHDLGIFFDRVSKYSRIINVDNLAIAATPTTQEKTIAATFTATTFVDDERDAQRSAQ